MSRADPVDYQTAPERYRHWKLKFDGPVATLHRRFRRERRHSARLQAQAQQLRSRGRHRAQRRGQPHPLRASGSADGRRRQRPGSGVLVRGQHLHARRLEPRLESQLLQVHQRDAQRPRGFLEIQRAQVPRRGQRVLRRRRLRACALLRRDRADRRPLERRQPARGPAARRSARHGRPHPPYRQAPCPA